MEMAWNALGKESSHSTHWSHQDSFEQHLERMRIFRKSHDLAEQNKCSRAPGAPHARIEPEAPEFHKLLTTLLITGYVLNLIQERGTILLPRNWQN